MSGAIVRPSRIRDCARSAASSRRTMRIAVPREVAPGESRVALVPDTVARLAKAGFDVQVETGAGIAAGFTDEAYREAGATIAPGAPSLLGSADVTAKVRAP